MHVQFPDNFLATANRRRSYQYNPDEQEVFDESYISFLRLDSFVISTTGESIIEGTLAILLK